MDDEGDAKAAEAEAEAAAGPRRAAPDLRRLLPLVGLGVAVWAALPKFVSPPLNTDPTVELADHVIPGIVVAVASLWGVVTSRNPKLSAGPFFAAMVVLLAGLWMMATHMPLVAQAFRGDAPWAGTIYHTASAMATFGLGLLWSVTRWPDLAALEAAGKPG